jgi:hypothetical protein
LIGSRSEGVRPRKRRYFPILTAFTTWLCVFVYIYMCAQVSPVHLHCCFFTSSLALERDHSRRRVNAGWQWPAYRMEYCRNFPKNTWYCSAEQQAKLQAASPIGPMAAFRTLVVRHPPAAHTC